MQVACELATNSVRHSTGPAAVRLKWLHPVLRVSVWDSAPELPECVLRSVDSVGGRGLLILDVLADRWGGLAIGEEPFGLGGKTIWFELSWERPPPPAAVTAAA